MDEWMKVVTRPALVGLIWWNDIAGIVIMIHANDSSYQQYHHHVSLISGIVCMTSQPIPWEPTTFNLKGVSQRYSEGLTPSFFQWLWGPKVGCWQRNHHFSMTFVLSSWSLFWWTQKSGEKCPSTCSHSVGKNGKQLFIPFLGLDFLNLDLWFCFLIPYGKKIITNTAECAECVFVKPIVAILFNNSTCVFFTHV